ncbi:hypothetical protein GCN78_07630 [Janthinobacterium rivuli]|nr:hypothetical protein GCN78_07630 [Janthinobacterium sp. FT68W]
MAARFQGTKIVGRGAVAAAHTAASDSTAGRCAARRAGCRTGRRRENPAGRRRRPARPCRRARRGATGAGRPGSARPAWTMRRTSPFRPANARPGS